MPLSPKPGIQLLALTVTHPVRLLLLQGGVLFYSLAPGCARARRFANDTPLPLLGES